MRNLKERGKQASKQIIKNQLKRVALAAGKKAFMALGAKLAIIIFPLLIIFAIVAVLIAATYGGMPHDHALTGAVQTDLDKELVEEYKKLVADDWHKNDQKPAWNAMDTWVVPGEGTWYDENVPIQDRIDNPVNLLRISDHYDYDERFKLDWGLVYSISLYYAYMNNKTVEELIDDKQHEYIAEKLHPHFYYKKSKIITKIWSKNSEGKCEFSTDVQEIYLLVESYSVKGHHTLEYEWKTVVSGVNNEKKCNKMERTYEVLTNVRQHLDPPEKRILDFIQEFYDLDSEQDTEDALLYVKEAGTAFNVKDENMEWLYGKFGKFGNIGSFAGIPDYILELIYEASEEYGIPPWFIAAIIAVETGKTFDPFAHNESSGAYGLTQIMPSNWARYAPLLGYDVVVDKDNPKAQIMVGMYLMKNYLGDYSSDQEYDWEGDGWKDQVMGAIAFYCGARTNGVVDQAAMDRARYDENVYAKFWTYAEEYKTSEVVWPVPGHRIITSDYKVQRSGGVHTGIDIGAPFGASVVSVTSGVVTHAGWLGGYGKCITIRDDVNVYYYAHLHDVPSGIQVAVGDTIKPGQTIGLIGSTGNSTGSHLHFEVRNANTNQHFDPRPILGLEKLKKK